MQENRAVKFLIAEAYVPWELDDRGRKRVILSILKHIISALYIAVDFL